MRRSKAVWLDAVYEAIVAHKLETGGRSPSVREIAARCKLASTSTTQAYLRRLAQDGRIVLSPGYRSIGLPGEQWLPPAGISYRTKCESWGGGDAP